MAGSCEPLQCVQEHRRNLPILPRNGGGLVNGLQNRQRGLGAGTLLRQGGLGGGHGARRPLTGAGVFGFRQPPSAGEIARRRAEEEAEAAKRERQALAVWREAVPVRGTLAETYLRGRGITCPLPDSLRFHPACWHGGTAQRLPAMIARVDGLPRLAVHRTYLRPDGSGKAEVHPAKAMLGAALGGAVRVADGHGPLVVAEGIETALSLPSGLLRGLRPSGPLCPPQGWPGCACQTASRTS